jgi:hypothetical protein
MLSLVPLGDVPAATSSPTTSPAIQKIQVQALSTWNALVIGVVTGFALAAGGLIFNKTAKRFRWV